MTRTDWLAWIGILGGGSMLVYSLATLYRALRYRFRRGAPYIVGSINRAITSALAGLAILVVGACLAGTSWALTGYERLTGMTEVALVRVVDPGDGVLLMEMQIGDPEAAPVQVAKGLGGERWSLHGTVVRFPAWCEPFGLTLHHRFVGAADPDREGPGPLDAAPDRSFFLAKLPAWLGIRVDRHVVDGRGPLPDWTGVAIGPDDGYFLAFPGRADGVEN